MTDCGAETQISGSGTSSRHPKFLAPAQASKFVAPAPERFGTKLKTENIALFVQLACYTKYVC